MSSGQDYAHDPGRWGAWRYILFGSVVIVGLFGGLGYWSMNTEISGAVVAPAKLRVETKQKPVQHPQGGVVGELFVREGQSVKLGDPLLRLEQITQDATRSILESQINELTARKMRLLSERDGLARVTFPSSLTEKAAQDPEIGKVVSDQRRLFVARANGYRQQVSQFRERIAQIDNQIGGSGARLTSLQSQLESVEGELTRVRSLLSRGLTTQTRLQEFLREKARIEGEIGALNSDTARLQRQIQETRSEILQLQETRREEAIAELRDVQGSINELDQRIVVANEDLRKIFVRSPQDGVVQDLAVFAAGAVVGPGQEIMVIVPTADRLVLEAKVDPTKRDQIKIDGPARVRFSSFNQDETPELNGKVVNISPDSKTDETTGASYYAVEILLSEEERGRIGNENQFVPGLPAEVFIETDKRTPMSYLLKPLADNFAKAFR